MAAGQEFWLVATGCAKTGSSQSEKEDLFQQLTSHTSLNQRGRRGNDGDTVTWKFQVPDGDRSLMFGSFDNLIRLTDELSKNDSQVDSIVHRLERQWLEIDPKAHFKVRSQRKENTFMDYIANWQWDEAKYPRTRSIMDNLTHLMSTVNKIDEEARNKTLLFNESKTQKANISSKDGGNLLSRDLVDILKPDVVQMRGSPDDDYIRTEHLATVFVILPRGTEKEFLSTYELMSDHVVPRSAKKFHGLDDKDGNTVWRVVMFKAGVEEFKKNSRDKRLAPRDFEYSEDAYKQLVAKREQINENVNRQHTNVKGLYQAAWSDAMVAWMHIKAMRIFVESVLRFGMPPRFAAFTIVPKASSTQARKALADILGKRAQEHSGPCSADKMAEAAFEDGEEYFPYVSFSFQPFTTPRT